MTEERVTALERMATELRDSNLQLRGALEEEEEEQCGVPRANPIVLSFQKFPKTVGPKETGEFKTGRPQCS